MSERTEGTLGAARVVEEVAVVAGAAHDEVETENKFILTKYYLYFVLLIQKCSSIIQNCEIQIRNLFWIINQGKMIVKMFTCGYLGSAGASEAPMSTI